MGWRKHVVRTPHVPSVIGFGEAILDCIWRPTADDGVILDIRGGGSVFNIVANLAQQGWRACMQGAAGGDDAGRFVIDDLATLGVDVGAMALQPRRRTRLVFESLTVDDRRQVGGMAHTFTTKCPVCAQRIADRQRPSLSGLPDSAVGHGYWVIYDQLTRSRIEHAQRSREAGARTVLDLGAVGYLRYQPTALILSHLREFDLIFLNQRVATSLTNRIGAPANSLGVLLEGNIIVTTQGPHGAVVSDAMGVTDRHPAPPVRRLVDDSGAGDALCSYTLDYLARQHAGPITATAVAAAVGHAQQLLVPVLTHVGARGHLPAAPSSALFESLQGRTLSELVNASTRQRQCALCQLPIDDPTSRASLAAECSAESQGSARGLKPGARRNTSLMLTRMLAAAEHPTAARRAAEILGESGTALVVGSGGSLPAATFIARLLNAAGRVAVALTPGDYLDGVACADTVIAVSYSGTTPDIRRVILAAQQQGVRRVVLLTSASKPTLADEMRPLSEDVVLSYGPADRSGDPQSARAVRERGFVSIAGTVTPCIPWLVAATGMSTVIDLVSRIRVGESQAVAAARTLARPAVASARLNVVYGPGASPAACDIESKFTESGLPAVTVHEQKDLSHGRFVTVMQAPHFRSEDERTAVPPPALMLATGPTSQYQHAVTTALREVAVPFAEIRTVTNDLAAPLELLTLVQFFSQAFGSELGIDISRPKRIPDAGLRLYRWQGRRL